MANMLKADTSEPIVYRRGAKTVTIDMVHPQNSDQVIDEQGFVVTVRSRDFIFLTADLILTGIEEKPQRGDQIEWDGGTYEVLPVSGGNLWEWTGNHHIQIKVHTQEVKA